MELNEILWGLIKFSGKLSAFMVEKSVLLSFLDILNLTVNLSLNFTASDSSLVYMSVQFEFSLQILIFNHHN